MNRTLFIRLSIFLASTASLYGCAGLGGQDDFSCPGMPEGISCVDPVTIYGNSHDVDDLEKLRKPKDGDEGKQNTQSNVFDSDISADQIDRSSMVKAPYTGENSAKASFEEAAPGKLVKITTIKNGKKHTGVYQSYINQKQLIVQPDSPLPILQPAEIGRIWIAPWTDANQDLHWPTYVFTEITPRLWSFGEPGVSAIKPVLPVLIDDGKKSKKRPNGKKRYTPNSRVITPATPNRSNLPENPTAKQQGTPNTEASPPVPPPSLR